MTDVMARASSLPFGQSLAVVLGINDYRGGICPLSTPEADAARLAALLRERHGFTLVDAPPEITGEWLTKLFTRILPTRLGPGDRLLFYFAGHGVALDGADGPAGFLIPQDARLGDLATYVPMAGIYEWLGQLPCRHLLAVLDCCYAGAFRWGSTRDLGTRRPGLDTARYDRFLRSPAWQALTSSAYDETALDALSGDERRGVTGGHSPFAAALFEALDGEADTSPPGGDGVITATELYLFLRDHVEVQARDKAGHEQTPMLWPLGRHGKGEFIFLNPNRSLSLKPAPPLTGENNPYRGLKAYEFKKADWELYFGREKEISRLAELVEAKPVVLVAGASGTGKSSLVQAGLLPYLQDPERTRPDAVPAVIGPFRPSATPLAALGRAASAAAGTASDGEGARVDENRLFEGVAGWLAAMSGRQAVLVVDQFEELITLCRSEPQRDSFIAILERLAAEHRDRLRIVLTLRTDFAALFAGTPLIRDAARFDVPLLEQDDLRLVIEEPAALRELFFDPPGLVNNLINEAGQMPGALPLLSFTLSELYLCYLKRQEGAQARGELMERSLTRADYDALGGVIGSLRTAADNVYASLPDDHHKATLQRIMLRMISVEGGEVARRRVLRSELDYPDPTENERVTGVLQRLVDARLVVTGQADEGAGAPGAGGQEGGSAPRPECYYEPAHDALVISWGRLLDWKREAEGYLPLQRKLAGDVAEWEARGRTPGLLWNEADGLPQIETLIEKRERGFPGRLRQLVWPAPPRTGQAAGWLNRRELAFVQASRVHRAAELRRIAGITAVVIVVLAALALYAFAQAGIARVAQQNESGARRLAETREAEAQSAATKEADARATAEGEKVAAQRAATQEAEARATAEQEKAAAEAAARRARAGELGAQSLALAGSDPALALLLAREAVSVTLQPDGLVVPRARVALLRAVSSPLRDIHAGWVDVSTDASGNPVLDPAAPGSQGGEGASVYDVWTGEAAEQVSDDGQRRVAPPREARISFQDGEGREIASLDGEAFSLHPSGRRLVTAAYWGTADREAHVWDADAQRLATFSPHLGGVLKLQYTGKTPHIVTWGCDEKPLAGQGCEAPSTRLWTVDDAVTASVAAGSPTIRRLDGDGDLLLAVECSEGEAQSGDPPCASLAETFGALWDIRTLPPQPLGRIDDVPLAWTFTGDGAGWEAVFCGERTDAGCENPRVVRYGLAAAEESAIPVKATAAAWPAAGGRRILFRAPTADEGLPAGEPPLMLWDRDADTFTLPGRSGAGYTWAALSPDGERIAAVEVSGRGFVWDAAGNPVSEVDFGTAMPSGLPTGAIGPGGHHAALVYCRFGHMGLCDDSDAVLWDLDRGRVRAVPAGSGYLATPVFSDDGSYVALLNAEHQTVQVWRLGDMGLRASIGGLSRPRFARFSREGDVLAIGDWDGQLRLLDLDGNLLAEVRAFDAWLTDARWLAEPGMIAVAGCDSWNRERSTCSRAGIRIVRFPTEIDQLLADAGRRLGDRRLTAEECQAYLGTAECPSPGNAN